MIGRRTLVPWLTPAKDTSRQLPPSQPPIKPSAAQPLKIQPEPKKVQQPTFQPLRCHLCGSSSPAVRCEQCSNLIFCLSCDDMYHRHPKRRDHVRKLAQRPITTSPPPRPPPKSINLNSPPVPPPRRKKSQASAPSSPEIQRKNDQKIPELPKKQFPLKFGSLKKLLPSMHGRSPAVSTSPSPQTPSQQQQKTEPFQLCHINTIDRRGSQRLQSPIRQNYQYNDWTSPAQPLDQSSSDFDDDDDRRSTGTGTSSGGIERRSYPMNDQWQNQPRMSATLDRRLHQTSTLLRHNNSFAAPGSSGPFIKRETPFYLHPPQPAPAHMNHSASVMDLSYQQSIGYPIPQVQSMGEGLDFAGTMAPCGCRPNWIGPDQFGAWLPPVRCPMHNSTAALYPQPQMVPPPPWGYHPYMTSASPPPPTPQPLQPRAQPQMQQQPRLLTQSQLSPPINKNRNSGIISPVPTKLDVVDSRHNRKQMLSSSSEDEDAKRGEYYSESDDDDEEDERKWQEELTKLKESNTATLKQNKSKPIERVDDKNSQWECEHCTFVNEPSNKICAVCCKTKGIRSISPTIEMEKLSLATPIKEAGSPINPKINEVKNDTKQTKLEIDVKPEEFRSPKIQSVSTSDNVKLQKAEVSAADAAVNVNLADTKATKSNDENNGSQSATRAPIASEEVYEEVLNAKVTMVSNAGTQYFEDDLPEAKLQQKPSQKEMDKVVLKDSHPAPLTKRVASTGTSPPPQTISTQTPIDMWPDSYSDEEEIPISPSPPPPLPPQSQPSSFLRKRIKGRKDASHLRRAASLQMMNRDRRFSGGFNDREEQEGDGYGYNSGSGWQQGNFRRTASRASLRDTSPSPPPPSTTGRNKRTPSYGRRRSSAYDPKAGYSSREEERGDDEYEMDDDDSNWSAGKSKKDYYLSMDNISNRRRSKTLKSEGNEILQLVKEADKASFTADDLQVAIYQCGNTNPVQWLKDNWKTMIDTVVTLASRKDNAIGVVSMLEAKMALHSHKGNIWAAVTECVESRHRKIKELQRRSGMLSKDEVTAALTASAGDVEEALLQINKTSLKPFLMKIYGPPNGIENEAGAIRQYHTSGNLSMLKNFEKAYKSQVTSSSCESPEDSYGEEFYVVNDGGNLSTFSYEQIAGSNAYATIDVKSGRIQTDNTKISNKTDINVDNKLKQSTIVSNKHRPEHNFENVEIDGQESSTAVINSLLNTSSSTNSNKLIETMPLKQESEDVLVDNNYTVPHQQKPLPTSILQHQDTSNSNKNEVNIMADKYDELIKEQVQLAADKSIMKCLMYRKY
ncbi:hypothetical protein CHUAL_001918 [Chamberlinius hualienensis]